MFTAKLRWHLYWCGLSLYKYYHCSSQFPSPACRRLCPVTEPNKLQSTSILTRRLSLPQLTRTGTSNKLHHKSIFVVSSGFSFENQHQEHFQKELQRTWNWILKSILETSKVLMDTKSNDLISFELMWYTFTVLQFLTLLDINNNKIPLLSVVQIHATILQCVRWWAINQASGVWWREVLEISYQCYQCSSGGRVSGAAAQPWDCNTTTSARSNTAGAATELQTNVG